MPDDDVMKEHQKFRPSCKLLRRLETNNVPLDPIDLNKKLPKYSSFDECGPLNTVIEGTVSACTIERLEKERMRKLLLKYSICIVPLVCEK